jgi:RNA polymerase sigma-70 factor (sigma-E family)
VAAVQTVGLTSNQTLADGPAAVLDFATAYERYHQEALRWANAIVLNPDAAADIVQEAFVRIFSRLRPMRDPSAFPAYLRRTIVNTANSRWRTESRDRLRSERIERLTTQIVPEAEIDPELLLAVERLPHRQRLVVILRYWLDWSEHDIAAALGCRPGTVKSLNSRALATLRMEFGDA